MNDEALYRTDTIYCTSFGVQILKNIVVYGSISALFGVQINERVQYLVSLRYSIKTNRVPAGLVLLYQHE
jgi:hypothetical protein